MKLLSAIEPKTGVFSIHSLEHLYDDIDNAIDLDFEVYCRDNCQQSCDSCDCDYESGGDDTYLIGFKFNEETGQYDIDTNAEYSAIVNTGQNTVQVIRSNWYLTGGLCSPCYPGQVDADSTTADIPAYSIPPSVIGDDNPNLTSRIFAIE